MKNKNLNKSNNNYKNYKQNKKLQVMNKTIMETKTESINKLNVRIILFQFYY